MRLDSNCLPIVSSQKEVAVLFEAGELSSVAKNAVDVNKVEVYHSFSVLISSVYRILSA